MDFYDSPYWSDRGTARILMWKRRFGEAPRLKFPLQGRTKIVTSNEQQMRQSQRVTKPGGNTE